MMNESEVLSIIPANHGKVISGRLLERRRQSKIVCTFLRLTGRLAGCYTLQAHLKVRPRIQRSWNPRASIRRYQRCVEGPNFVAGTARAGPLEHQALSSIDPKSLRPSQAVQELHRIAAAAKKAHIRERLQTVMSLSFSSASDHAGRYRCLLAGVCVLTGSPAQSEGAHCSLAA